MENTGNYFFLILYDSRYIRVTIFATKRSPRSEFNSSTCWSLFLHCGFPRFSISMLYPLDVCPTSIEMWIRVKFLECLPFWRMRGRERWSSKMEREREQKENWLFVKPTYFHRDNDFSVRITLVVNYEFLLVIQKLHYLFLFSFSPIIHELTIFMIAFHSLI